jgi:hypothetical protein
MANTMHDLAGPLVQQTLIPPAAAGDATASRVVFMAPFACRIRSVTIVPAAGITGQATNTFNLNVINRGVDGASSTEVANRDYLSGTNETAYTRRVLYQPSTPLSLAAGACLDLQRELVGTGLAMPSLLVVVEYEAA